MKLHFYKKLGFVVVPILSLEKLSFVNIFTLLKHGLLLNMLKKNINQRYLPMMLFNAINVVQLESTNTVNMEINRYSNVKIVHKFRDSLLKKIKFRPEIVKLTLDLYFSGLSLRKVARNINDHFNIELNYSTIYGWIQTYIPQISNYVNSLTPQLSESWHYR